MNYKVLFFLTPHLVLASRSVIHLGYTVFCVTRDSRAEIVGIVFVRGWILNNKVLCFLTPHLALPSRSVVHLGPTVFCATRDSRAEIVGSVICEDLATEQQSIVSLNAALSFSIKIRDPPRFQRILRDARLARRMCWNCNW